MVRDEERRWGGAVSCVAGGGAGVPWAAVLQDMVTQQSHVRLGGSSFLVKPSCGLNC